MGENIPDADVMVSLSALTVLVPVEGHHGPIIDRETFELHAGRDGAEEGTERAPKQVAVRHLLYVKLKCRTKG